MSLHLLSACWYLPSIDTHIFVASHYYRTSSPKWCERLYRQKIYLIHMDVNKTTPDISSRISSIKKIPLAILFLTFMMIIYLLFKDKVYSVHPVTVSLCRLDFKAIWMELRDRRLRWVLHGNSVPPGSYWNLLFPFPIFEAFSNWMRQG